MQVGDPALRDKVERLRGMVFRLGREARNEVGADRHFGPQVADLSAERYGFHPRVSAFHALQDQVGTALQ